LSSSVNVLPIASMTGFARAEGSLEGFSWAWELKSVNSKSLDVRLRLPAGLDHLEPQLRQGLAARMKRGAVSASLAVQQAAGAGGVRVNRVVLSQVLALVDELAAKSTLAPARIDGVLALRGVLEPSEEAETPEQHEARAAVLLAGFDEAASRLVATRLAEGERLAAVLRERLDEIAALADAAERCAALQPEPIRARLRTLLAALLENATGLSEERLAQEAALIIARADVREELDRLRAHLAAAADLLAEGTAIGRRFDFLCQEFNREANTLCSKSSDVELTRIGLALKAAIEQLREQVQNIE
jgi:uncharacterized protein (TIGR00255 family)